ncbi:uncharacterized protein LOC144351921 [Saccoglossus kowalevskii]
MQLYLPECSQKKKKKEINNGMFCGKRRRENMLEQFCFETAIVVDQHTPGPCDQTRRPKRSCNNGVSSLPKNFVQSNGFLGTAYSGFETEHRIHGLQNGMKLREYMDCQSPSPAACEVDAEKFTSQPVCTIPDGILVNFNNNCNIDESADSEMETNTPPVSHIVPVKRRMCIRCMAGEPGHITHILQ